MASSPDAQISLRGVTKVFPGHDGHPDVHALGPIDLDIAAGEFFTVVGPSGCGKSTLLDVLSGLATATAGLATFEGRALDGRVPDGIGAVKSVQPVAELVARLAREYAEAKRGVCG